MEPQRGITLRFLAEPTDVNFGGKVHGGAVMKWIDQAGYTCAAGWTGTYCVTVYLGGLHFLGPIRVGELVELRALVIRTGEPAWISRSMYMRETRRVQSAGAPGIASSCSWPSAPTGGRPRYVSGRPRRRWIAPSAAMRSAFRRFGSRWMKRWRRSSAERPKVCIHRLDCPSRGVWWVVRTRGIFQRPPVTAGGSTRRSLRPAAP